MYSPSDILSLSLSSVLQPAHICVEFYSPYVMKTFNYVNLIDISFLINFSSSDGCTDITLIDPNSDCDFVYEPVCGCNGITYINSCEATNYGGVISWSLGHVTLDEDKFGNDTDEEEYDEDTDKMVGGMEMHAMKNVTEIVGGKMMTETEDDGDDENSR